MYVEALDNEQDNPLVAIFYRASEQLINQYLQQLAYPKMGIIRVVIYSNLHQTLYAFERQSLEEPFKEITDITNIKPHPTTLTHVHNHNKQFIENWLLH